MQTDKTDILDFDKKYEFVQIPNILLNNKDNITLEFSLIKDLFLTGGLSFEEVGLYFMLWSISDKSLILYNITDLAKLGNCGVDKVKGLINKLIKKKLLIEFRKNKRIYFFKILPPDEDYENAKKEFLRR